MLAHLVDMSLVVADTNIREQVEQAVPNLTLTIQRNLEVPEEPIEFSDRNSIVEDTQRFLKKIKYSGRVLCQQTT